MVLNNFLFITSGVKFIDLAQGLLMKDVTDKQPGDVIDMLIRQK